MSSFLKRHPRLSVRKAKATSIFKAAEFNKEKVNKFYDLMEAIIFKNNLKVIPDTNTYNVDKSG